MTRADVTISVAAVAFVVGAWVGYLNGRPPERELDLDLVNRTLTMAERCTAVTETALRALLPRYDTTETAPDSLPGG